MTLECKLCGAKDASPVRLAVGFGDLGKGPVNVPLCPEHRAEYEGKKEENVVSS